MLPDLSTLPKDDLYELANKYINGPNAKKNEALILQALTMAAEKGHIEAAYQLGMFYLKHKTYKKDLNINEVFANAIKWLEIATKNGHPAAAEDLYKLSFIYAYGFPVPADASRACDLILLTANHGCVAAKKFFEVLCSRAMGQEGTNIGVQLARNTYAEFEKNCSSWKISRKLNHTPGNRLVLTREMQKNWMCFNVAVLPVARRYLNCCSSIDGVTDLVMQTLVSQHVSEFPCDLKNAVRDVLFTNNRSEILKPAVKLASTPSNSTTNTSGNSHQQSTTDQSRPRHRPKKAVVVTPPPSLAITESELISKINAIVVPKFTESDNALTIVCKKYESMIASTEKLLKSRSVVSCPEDEIYADMEKTIDRIQQLKKMFDEKRKIFEKDHNTLKQELEILKIGLENFQIEELQQKLEQSTRLKESINELTRKQEIYEGEDGAPKEMYSLFRHLEALHNKLSKVKSEDKQKQEKQKQLLTEQQQKQEEKLLKAYKKEWQKKEQLEKKAKETLEKAKGKQKTLPKSKKDKSEKCCATKKPFNFNWAQLSNEFVAKSLSLSHISEVMEIDEVKIRCLRYNWLKICEILKTSRCPAVRHKANELRNCLLYHETNDNECVNSKFLLALAKNIKNGYNDLREIDFEAFDKIFPTAIQETYRQVYEIWKEELTEKRCVNQILLSLQFINEMNGKSGATDLFSPIQSEALLMAMIDIGARLKELRLLGKDPFSNCDSAVRNFFRVCTRMKIVFMHEENDQELSPAERVVMNDEVVSYTFIAGDLIARIHAASDPSAKKTCVASSHSASRDNAAKGHYGNGTSSVFFPPHGTAASSSTSARTMATASVAVAGSACCSSAVNTFAIPAKVESSQEAEASRIAILNKTAVDTTINFIPRKKAVVATATTGSPICAVTAKTSSVAKTSATAVKVGADLVTGNDVDSPQKGPY